MSHRLQIEIVPTLIRFEGGREVGRTYGWDRGEWERLTGIAALGHDLLERRGFQLVRHRHRVSRIETNRPARRILAATRAGE